MNIRRGAQAGTASHRIVEGSRFGIVAPAKYDAMRLRGLASKLLARWQRGALASPGTGAGRLVS